MKFLYAVLTLIVSCLADFYKPMQTSKDIRGKIVLQKNQPSTLSCVHTCKFKQANSIYENGVCTCVKEENDEETLAMHNVNIQPFSFSSQLWIKKNIVSFSFLSNPTVNLVHFGTHFIWK